jgi:hypothetical protein
MSNTEALERLKKTGRNDDCPCGSGKKYKKCHLREDEEAASKTLAANNAERAKATAAGEEPGHEGHGHGPGGHPKASPQTSQSGAPKTPLSHKPMNTPRKAV